MRKETATLFNNMANLHAASAQLIVKSPYDELIFQVYESSRDRAILCYQQAGQTMQPWDASWTESINAMREKIDNRQHAIADTSITDKALVTMIKEYEELKKTMEEEKKSANESI